MDRRKKKKDIEEDGRKRGNRREREGGRIKGK